MGQSYCAGSAARLVLAALAMQTVLFRTERSRAAETTMYAPYQIEATGDRGITLSSTNSENWYAVTIGGTSADVSNGGQSLQPGETWRRSLQAEVQGKFGSLFTLDLHSRFTQAAREADDSLFALQTVDGNGQRGALQDYRLSTKFLGGRISFDSAHQVSMLAGLNPGAYGVNGSADSDSFSASLWKSGIVEFSINGGFDRVEANYGDIDSTSADTSLKDKERSRIGTKLTVGKAGLFANETSQSELSDAGAPKQSELETGVSLNLSDWRKTKTKFFQPVLALLPDSVWASTSNGEQEQISGAAAESEELQKTAFGADRNWSHGGLNFNYWRMTIDAPPAIAEGPQWRGEGVTAGGNYHAGPWSLSGNLSWNRDGNFGPQSNTGESNINGSVFLTWQHPDLPKLSAGVMNSGYEQQFFDFDGINRNGSLRYQLALDFSPLLASTLDDKTTQVSVIGSYQGNTTESLWGAAGQSDTVGNVFFGLRLTQPLMR